MKPELDVTVSSEDIQAVLESLGSIHQKLAFLKGLTSEERRELVHAGSRSQSFIDLALDIAAKHPDLMPGCLDVDAARRDVALAEALQPVAVALNQLCSLVEDTQRLANSEAYAAARLAYQSVKINGRGMGLDEVIDDLKRQFRRPRRRSAPTPVEVS